MARTLLRKRVCLPFLTLPTKSKGGGASGGGAAAAGTVTAGQLASIVAKKAVKKGSLDKLANSLKASIDNVALACGVEQVGMLLDHDGERNVDIAYQRFTDKLTKFTTQLVQRADNFARRSHTQAGKEAAPVENAQKSDHTIDLRSVMIAAGTNSASNTTHRVTKATGSGEPSAQRRARSSDFLTLAQQQGLISNLAVDDWMPTDITVPPPWASRSPESQSSKDGDSRGLPASIIGILRQVHPDTQLAPALWHQMIQFAIHMCHRMGSAACVSAAAAAAPLPPSRTAVAKVARQLQVDGNDIHECAALVLPGELIKHGRKEIQKAMDRYDKDHADVLPKKEAEEKKDTIGTQESKSGGGTPVVLTIKRMFGSSVVPTVHNVDLAIPPGIAIEGDAASGVTVKFVKPGKNADLSGVVKAGMKILSINGTSVVGKTPQEAAVLIKRLKGKEGTFPFRFKTVPSTPTTTPDASDTIKMVKAKIHSMEGFEQCPPEKQRLLFSGKLLEDDSTLSSYGIKPNSTIHVHRIPDPPKAMVSSADAAFYLAQIAPGKVGFSPRAAHAAAALMEYLLFEILELAGNVARDDKSDTIFPNHVVAAIEKDEELNEMCETLGLVWSLSRIPGSYNRRQMLVHGHSKSDPIPQISVLPLDPLYDLTIPLQPSASFTAQTALERHIASIEATVTACKDKFDKHDFEQINQKSQADITAAKAAAGRFAAAAGSGPIQRIIKAVVPKEFWVGTCSERAAGAGAGVDAAAVAGSADDTINKLYHNPGPDSYEYHNCGEALSGALQWRLTPPEEENQLQTLDDVLKTGYPSDPSVTKGSYPSTDEADLGPTSKYQAADLDAAPRDGESLWRGPEMWYPADDVATAYVAEPEFRKQTASGATRPAAVMEARSLWGLAWQVECPGLDEATVLAALTTLGREWIADQLRQMPSVSARAGAAAEVAKGACKDPAREKETLEQHDLIRVTTGELLGTMDVVPLLPSRVTGLDPSTDAPAYRTGYLTEFAKWLLLRRWQRERDGDEEAEKTEEFEDVPHSIAEVLKDGCLNPTGLFEEETFADIAVCSSSGLTAMREFAQERAKMKCENRPDGAYEGAEYDDTYRLPPTPNMLTYTTMVGLWIKPCHFQSIVMGVLEQLPGCSGGWIQRSALHALQVSFERVVSNTLVEARKSAAVRKSAIVAGADVAFGAFESGLSQSASNTINWPAVEKAAALEGAAGGAQQQQLSSEVNAFVELSGCISAPKSLVEATTIRDLVVGAARDINMHVKISQDALTGLVAMVEGRLTTMMLGEGRRVLSRAAADTLQGDGFSLHSVPEEDWVAAGVNLDEPCGATEAGKAQAIHAAITKLGQFQAK